MRVLVACEFSGIVRDAFIAKGHDAVSCDLLPTDRPGPHIQGDVIALINQGWDLMIAHPPCTYLCVSGSRWFTRPGRKELQDEALSFVRVLLSAPIPRICLENPVSIISTRIRKPDQIIQPYQFGHTMAKKTCLWLKNLPKLRPTDVRKPDYVDVGNGKQMSRWYVETWNLPKKERSKERSRTFQGIADAMADQWGSLQ